MDIFTICSALLLWLALPVILLVILEFMKRKLEFGSLYANKAHKNGGLDPNDPTIDKIDLVEISGINENLYARK